MEAERAKMKKSYFMCVCQYVDYTMSNDRRINNELKRI
jgi:hypothetical protein